MRRFAIYYVPAETSALTRAAAEWLGRDAFTGAELPGPAENGFSREVWKAVTLDPRIYGFHATLKAPFRLAEGASEEDLRRSLRDFAAQRRPFRAAVQLGSISRFLALVLARPCPRFVELAADCVCEFDRFRAPASEQELSRRRARLNPAQSALLEQWGYPYVMKEWRFHMTLTASLGPETFLAIHAHLTEVFAPPCQDPLLVDSICLFEQPAEGEPFHVLERFHFQ